jgi:hypothetical protein
MKPSVNKILTKLSKEKVLEKVELGLYDDIKQLDKKDANLEARFAATGSKIEAECKSFLKDLNSYLQNNDAKRKAIRKILEEKTKIEKELGVTVRIPSTIKDEDGSAISQIKTMISTVQRFISDLKSI